MSNGSIAIRRHPASSQPDETRANYGIIDDDWCNEDKLEWTTRQLLNAIGAGRDIGLFASALTSGELPG